MAAHVEKAASGVKRIVPTAVIMAVRKCTASQARELTKETLSNKAGYAGKNAGATTNSAKATSSAGAVNIRAIVTAAKAYK